MLQLSHLFFDYQDTPLLTDLCLEIAAGELVHLLGANGAGKTTLLKLIAGLYRPVQGDIKFQGQSIYNQLRQYQKQLCYVGHKTGVSLHLTIREHCSFDPHLYKIKDKGELITLFNLKRYLNTPCGLLSAGQRRQVGLLRLWGTEAKVWLLDEPLVALDTNSVDILMRRIEQHRKQGGIVLMTSHQTLPLDRSSYLEHCL